MGSQDMSGRLTPEDFLAMWSDLEAAKQRIFDSIPQECPRFDSASLSRCSISQDVLSALIDYNKAALRCAPSRREDPPAYPANLCELLTEKTDIPLRWRVYHAGPVGQSFLRGSKPYFMGRKFDDHVYFSLTVEGVLNYIDDRPEYGAGPCGLFVIDLRTVKQGLVFKDYQSTVLFKDRLSELIACHKDPDLISRSIDDLPAGRYLLDLKDRSHEGIKNEILSDIGDWLMKHTLPFNINRVERYRRARMDYVLVKQPVGVNSVL